MNKNFVNTDNPQSRPDGEYAKTIQKIAGEGICPFCKENLTKYHDLPVEEKKYWLVTDNKWPYKPSKNHRLIIHKEHATHIRELTNEAWTELREILQLECASRAVEGGTLVIRFGDTHYTGASVVHLHAHLVQSDPDDPAYDKSKGLTMRIG